MNNITTDYPLTVQVTNPYSETSSKSLTLRMLATSVLLGNTASNGTTAVAYTFPAISAITNSPISGTAASWVAASPTANKMVLKVGSNEKTYNLADLSAGATTASSNVFTEMYKNFAYSLTTRTLSRVGQTTASLDVSSNIGTGETLRVSQDGSMVAAAGTTGTAVVNTVDMTLRRAVTTYSQFPSVSTDGAYVAVGSNTTAAGIYRLSDGARMLSLSQKQLPCYSADGSKVAFASSVEDGTPTIVVYTTGGNTLVATLSLPTRATSLQFFQSDLLVVGQGVSSAPLRVYNVLDWSLVTLPSISAAGVVPTNIVIMGNSTITQVALDAYTKLLLHFDGLQGKTATDTRGGSFTYTGTPTISQTYRKNNFASIYFDGSSNLVMPYNSTFNFGTADFTLDAWVYSTARTASIGGIWGIDGGSGTNPKFGFSLNSSGAPQIDWATFTPGTGNMATATSTVALNTWTHVAFVRSSLTYTFYINGVACGTGAYPQNIVFTNQVSNIGYFGEGSLRFIGYLDDVRISNSARWTATFTPPTAVVDDANTMLHVVANPGFNDFKSNSLTVTGAPVIDSAAVFDGTCAYFPAGSGNSLAISPGTGVNFGLGGAPWTMDFNFKQTAWGSDGDMVGLYGSAATWGYSSGIAWRVSIMSTWISIAAKSTTSEASDGLTVVNHNCTINLNTWYHVALVYDGTNVSSYLDGVWKGTSPIVFQTSPGNLTCNMTIGNYPWTAGYSGSVFIDEFRLSKGIQRWTSSFIPPTSAYTVDGNTTVLIHMGTAAAPHTFVEETGKTLSRNGAAQLNNMAMFSGAGSFDGTGYLTLPVNAISPGTGPFTVEMWVKSGGGYGLWTVAAGGGGMVNKFVMYLNGLVPTIHWNWASSYTYYTSTATISANVWTHLAFVRTGSNWTWFVNGVVSGTGAEANNNIGFSQTMHNIGNGNEASFPPLNGYMDEFRLSNVARWSSGFTPATAPYVTDANTLALLHMDNVTPGVFTDETGKTVTKVSNVSIKSNNAFIGRNSLYTNGSASSYIEVPASGTSWHLSAPPWTLDYWVKINAWGSSTYAMVAEMGTGAGASAWYYSSGLAYQIWMTATAVGIAYKADTTDAATNVVRSAACTIGTGVWCHVAMVHDGTNVSFYVDGLLKGTSAMAALTSPNNSTKPLRINDADATYALNGYIDELRFSKTARWTANFIPPTIAYTS